MGEHSPTARRSNWLLEAMQTTLREAAFYGRTALAVTIGPRRFALAWKRDRSTFMNPLGFLAATLGAVGTLDGLAQFFVVHAPSDASTSASPSMLASLAEWGAPFVYYLLLGLLAQLLLWLFRAGGELLDGVAMSVYAGGGPATLLALIAKGAVAVYVAHGHPGGLQVTLTTDLSGVVALGIGSPFFLYCWALGSGLRAMSVKPVARWKIAVVMLASVVAAGFAFGYVDPPGEYGIHPVFTYTGGAHGHRNLNFSIKS